MTNVLEATVTKVIDGDTLLVEANGRELTVRVWGIDAPEMGQPYGPKARRAARELVSDGGDRKVHVHVEETGPYGRVIGRVRCRKFGDVDLACALVRQGYAWHSRDYRTTRALRQLETQAQRGGDGLWSQPDPTPPWVFRDRRKEKDLTDVFREAWDLVRFFWRVLS